MDKIVLDETKLKQLLKTAIIESVQENREIFSQLLAEALEDIGMENAIQEGEDSETVSRDEIFQILKG
ncbi:hypothetical protein [Roseofilum casamattae]|uniref:CopG family transcriptional regulator n=1 Tax=Roseofilum casamattae BLCC-M143 TaxID=3022442 RepID=A0ABT7BUJ8_9CYAN|nr:hypothetical protein [Roseofilum casamattae]MDJ1182852.1 hypothetical protein [Roseofilum casamattae BLCC-M143]